MWISPQLEEHPRQLQLLPRSQMQTEVPVPSYVASGTSFQGG